MCVVWKLEYQETWQDKKNRVLPKINKTKKILRGFTARIVKRHLLLGEKREVNTLMSYLQK